MKRTRFLTFDMISNFMDVGDESVASYLGAATPEATGSKEDRLYSLEEAVAAIVGHELVGRFEFHEEVDEVIHTLSRELDLWNLHPNTILRICYRDGYRLSILTGVSMERQLRMQIDPSLLIVDLEDIVNESWNHSVTMGTLLRASRKRLEPPKAEDSATSGPA